MEQYQLQEPDEGYGGGPGESGNAQSRPAPPRKHSLPATDVTHEEICALFSQLGHADRAGRPLEIWRHLSTC